MNTIYIVLTLAAICLLYNWAPLSSTAFFFGRRVESGFRETKNGRSILARYRLGLWMGCLIGIASALVFPTYSQHHPSLLVGVLIQMVISTLAFATANASVAKFGVQPAQGVTVNLTGSYVSHPMLEWPILTPVCIVVASIGLTLLSAHRGFDGSGFGWLNDSLEGAGAMPIFSVGLGLLLSSTVILLMIRLRARRNAAMARLTEQTGLALAYLAATSVVVACSAAVLGYSIPHFAKDATIWLAVAIGAVHFVRGMRRTEAMAPPAAELNDDRLWRWGLFYFNRRDPAMLVQKRCGVGMTLNFAHTISWVLTLAFVAAVVTVFVAEFHR